MAWLLMPIALIGGFLLLNGALNDVLPRVARAQVFVALLVIGSGRRMLQDVIHGRRARRGG